MPGHQNGFGGLYAGPIDQGEMRRLKVESERYGIPEGHFVGYEMAILLGGHGLLGKAARFDESQNPVAGLHARHAGSDGRHLTSELLARHERQFRQALIFALDHEQVREVQARGVDIDDDLSVTRDWHRYLTDLVQRLR